MNWLVSINELYLLGGILQVPGFIGLEDPFPGFLIEEIQECMEAARQTLSERGYLETTDDGFLLDQELIKTIQTMATSPSVIIAAKDDTSLFVFLDSEFGVLQESMQDGRISIYTIEDPFEIKEHIHSFLKLPATPAASGYPFQIDSAILEETRNLGSNEWKTPPYKKFLVGKGIKQEVASRLSEILTMTSVTGSLVLLNRKGLSIMPQPNLAWVIGDQGGWAVEPLEAVPNSILSWKPASSSEISAQIQRILESI